MGHGFGTKLVHTPSGNGDKHQVVQSRGPAPMGLIQHIGTGLEHNVVTRADIAGSVEPRLPRRIAELLKLPFKRRP